MADMDGWDIALIVAGSYIAVTTLVRLMRNHRNQYKMDLKQRIEEEKKRRLAEEALKKSKKSDRAA